VAVLDWLTQERRQVSDEMELSPAMKIFAWRGNVTRTAPPAASASDCTPIIGESVSPAAEFGELVVNSNAFPENVLKAVATALKVRGSVPAVTEAMPTRALSESIVEAGIVDDYLGDEPDSEEYADYTLRTWKDGGLVKHLAIRLKKARALQFMHCFAANFPFGSDVALYIGLHEPAVNISIEKLVSEVRAPAR
jgi:hypothetical protein